MKVLAVIFGCAFLAQCTSGSDLDVRNKDIFDRAKELPSVTFTTTPATFDGKIQDLRTAIMDPGNGNAELACSGIAGCPTTIEGIVSIPSNYGIAVSPTGQVNQGGNDVTTPYDGCSGPVAAIDRIYSRSFVLHDGNAGILIAYGLEPPVQEVPSPPPAPQSAKYIAYARNSGIAPFGSRIRLTVLKVQKYGVGNTDVLPIVTDFDPTTVSVISSGNAVPYEKKDATTDFTRSADLYKVRQLEGYVTSSPKYVECSSTGSSAPTRQFQFNFQKGYMGTICVGATSYQDAQTCTGTKRPFNFQLSLYLGAGTLSGFDTGDMYSYNIAKGAKVRMTGPVFTPRYNQPETNLSLMLGQRLQVETIP